MHKPASEGTWDEELWRLRRLYGEGRDDRGKDKSEAFSVKEEEQEEAAAASAPQKEGVRRSLRLVFHCTDPDWEAINWAPEGLFLEVDVPAAYPRHSRELPQLRLLGPDDLPERFTSLVPLLFQESVKQAPTLSPAIYRGLQHLDRHITALFLKVRAAAEREADAAEAAEAAALERQRRREKAETLEARRRREEAGGGGGGATDARDTSLFEEEEDGRYSGGSLGSEGEEAEGGDGRAAARGAAAAAATRDGAEDIRRLGSEVRLLGLSLEGFDTLMPRVVRLQAVCLRCKKPADLESDEVSRDLVARCAQAPCAICKQVLEVRVAPAICHGGCPSVAHVLGVGCQPVQFLRSDFEATCGECTEVVRVRNVGPGYRKRSSCAGCHAKLNLTVDGAELLGQAVGHWRQVAEVEGERMNARRQLQEARQREKNMGIKVGQPLPENGTCRHYSKSYRWLRFPCCGTAFPCGECHDAQTDHPHEWANRMLCGRCSHEQPFNKDHCTHCGAAQSRSRSAFWEGGEGCRNQVAMSKNDPRKFRGLGKCISSKVSSRIAKGH